MFYFMCQSDLLFVQQVYGGQQASKVDNSYNHTQSVCLLECFNFWSICFDQCFETLLGGV